MMNRFLLVVLLSTIFLMKAEAQRDKEFQIRAGFGWSVYDADFELKDKSNNTVFKNEDGALSIQLPLEFRYEITERFNLGLDMKFGSYVYEPDSAEGKSNRFFVFGIAGEYTIVNKEDFRWYVGLGFHTASLILEEQSEDVILQKEEEWSYSGGGIRLNTGVLIYLGKSIGLNFNLGLDTHNFNLDKYVLNDKKQDLSNIEATLKLSGLDGTIGLVYRIPRKSK